MIALKLLDFLEEEYGVSSEDAIDYLREDYEISEVISLMSDGDALIDELAVKGSSKNDLIIGDKADTVIRARRGHDLVFGLHGNDRLFGGPGDDHLIGDFLPSRKDFDAQGQLIPFEGTTANDTLIGGPGDDVLVDQYGSDRMRGGKGDDRLISVSDSGTPKENKRIPAEVEDGDDLGKLRFARRFYNPGDYDSNDRLTGGEGADVFEWNLLINAPKSIVAAETEDDGEIVWGMGGVAGRNDNYHDHWVDGIGRDVITDFSGEGGEGDAIIIKGHTVEAMLLSETETKAVIGVYSDQQGDGKRGGGAHDFDVLGKIVVIHDGAFDFETDVTIEGVDYGAYGQGSDIFEVYGFV